MKSVRAVTWYLRFISRLMKRAENWPWVRTSADLGVVFLPFAFLVPMLVGGLIFALLHVSGLTQLFRNQPWPVFYEDRSDVLNGALTFAIGATVAFWAYFILGLICTFADAFRPPNFQNKRQPLKNWPE